MEERQAVCAALRELDPENSSNYTDEVITLSNQLALDDGQYIVGRTRIHVDTDAFSRWAVRSIAEDYARYRDLLSVQEVIGQNFDDVLRELLLSPDSHKDLFVPETEADAVLANLLRRLGEEFLTNSTFGLDFYLSKRVRHQSFIGLIRSPLEISQIITTRETESAPYHRNSFWIEQLSPETPALDLELELAFTDFSQKFDALLTGAKDERFQLRSAEKPHGLLYLEINQRMISLARAIAKEDATVEDFIRTAALLFWGSLENSLSLARRYIAEELKVSVADLLDGLRATVRANTKSDTAFRAFDMEASARAAEVQRALDDSVAWFSHSDLKAAQRQFTLGQCVKIAIDSAMKSQRAFEADLHTSVNSELMMSADSLVFVHDVLFAALDNIHSHSGLKRPRVDVNVVADEHAETLLIEVVSDMKPQNRLLKERPLADLRKLIDTKSVGGRTRKEGRSGFLKLAATLGHSEKGRIEFGFLMDGRFSLRVTYSLIIMPSNLTESS